MQNKGVITLFAIVFALACLYEFSYTLLRSSVQSDAREFANGDINERKQLFRLHVERRSLSCFRIHLFSEVKNK
jgi:SecD/SecF fusion protein